MNENQDPHRTQNYEILGYWKQRRAKKLLEKKKKKTYNKDLELEWHWKPEEREELPPTFWRKIILSLEFYNQFKKCEERIKTY